MANERPLIGIDGVLVAGDSPYVKLATRYANAVLKAGGVPVVLAPIGGPSDIERVLERIDGLLFSGGDDFDTARLGLGPTHPAAVLVPSEKQDWDFEAARRAVACGLPVLGICYGMQLLGLAEGARIHQHLPDDRPGCRAHSGGVRHEVMLEPGSRLSRILGEHATSIVSRHHQALAEVAAPWTVCARDSEGLIEAIERGGHPFAIGVQWHPELGEEGGVQDRLFRALIGAAAIHASRRAMSSATGIATSSTTPMAMPSTTPGATSSAIPSAKSTATSSASPTATSSATPSDRTRDAQRGDPGAERERPSIAASEQISRSSARST